jgi:hypothetical protein
MTDITKFTDIIKFTDTDKFIDIYNCDKLYNIYDKKLSNVLKSIKIDFRTETDYDIFINDEI